MNGEQKAELAGIGMEAVREAEMAVLGGLILDPDSILKVKDILTPDMFNTWQSQTLFRCILDLDEGGQPADYVGINWWMDDHGHGEDIPPHVITELVAATPSAMYVEHYAKLVHQAHRARTLQEILGQAVGKLYEDEADLDQIQKWVQDKMLENGGRDSGPTMLADRVDAVMDNLEQTIQAQEDGVQIGLKFGLNFLDQILGGLRSGDLTLLAGRPGMGKTTAALQMALKTAEDGCLVFFYSLEMSADQLILKLVSNMTGIPYNRLRSGEVHEDEKVYLAAARAHLKGLPIMVVDDAFTVEDIVVNARRNAMKHGDPWLIVVDYIQLANSDQKGLGGNQNALVSHISRSFKLLARTLNCSMLALSQLNRSVEQRADKRPVLSDLRDSGSLEQDADQALFVYREGYYDDASETPNILEFLVRKNRHGSTGVASTFFKLETGQIRELEVVRSELTY